MIHATLMLCDHAQVAEGKLFIAGGGWSYANRLQGYVAILLRIPWEYAQRHILGSLTLVDQDDSEVVGASGDPVRISFELVGAPNVKAERGFPLDAPIAIPVPPIELPLGRYKWVFVLDGEARPDCDLPFRIVEPPQPLLPGGVVQGPR